jgi:hypothetical protein
MKRVKEFFINRPILFGFTLIMLYLVLAIISYPISCLFPAKEPYLLYGEAFAKFIIFAVFFLILWRFGWSHSFIES